MEIFMLQTTITRLESLAPLDVTEEDIAVSRASQLFAEVLPDTPVPDEAEFHRWFQRAGSDTAALATAIRRAARKRTDEGLRGFEMDSEQVGGFIAKTIKMAKRR
jgi:hypothetical protein